MRVYICNLVMKLQGTPYIWGGSNPRGGFDCSGLVVWVLQVFGLLPAGDWTAHDLYRRFAETESPEPGDLVFYGIPKKVTHVMVCIGGDLCIGASGGDSTCTDELIALKRNAMVKVKPVNYRRDRVAYCSIVKKWV